jgi:N-acetylglucosaminyl-diphospho-decaprenol L-rhamnosyltransferase
LLPQELNDVAVIIVGFKNYADISKCLRSLQRLEPHPTFDVFIAENGGEEGLRGLLAALSKGDLGCISLPSATVPTAAGQTGPVHIFALAREGSGQARVYIAEMEDNLGYAGGVNAWLRPLLGESGWSAAWILNPDTEPFPDTLAALSAAARGRDKGMIGSCIVSASNPQKIASQGLEWRPWTATVRAVGRGGDVASGGGFAKVESLISAPSGASIYVTRSLVEKIGLMNDDYFLYFEDLEWGLKAKAVGQLAYCHEARVRHQQGTTIGSSSNRRDRSSLSTYLLSRNLILFVRRNFPRWIFWTLLAQMRVVAGYVIYRAWRNLGMSCRGIMRGLAGEAGRPRDV